MVVIAGIDEAGRGPLAGPVVAAACVLTVPLFRRRSSPGWSPFQRRRKPDCIIADSKQLTPEERAVAFAWIVRHCAFGIGIVSHQVIETKGIRPSTFLAMRRAVANLRRAVTPDRLRIDGNDRFRFDIPADYIVRGDCSDPAIAAASIIAKVTRDRIMVKSERIFPGYGFASHKGYGSEGHIKRIRDLGPCPIHRPSFLRRILYAAEESMPCEA